ncbi:MAG: glycosyltransferase family 39 protein [Gemmatimonadota bacterium]
MLGYWHALSFRLFGVHLLSLRVILYLSFLPFLAATFALARRFVERRWAAVAAAAAAVWGVPNYPASMPTWYNLFLAVVALLAFARFLESGRQVWLVGAGAAAGASVLFKLVGVFSLAGLLLALFVCSPWVGERVGFRPGLGRGPDVRLASQRARPGRSRW